MSSKLAYVSTLYFLDTRDNLSDDNANAIFSLGTNNLFSGNVVGFLCSLIAVQFENTVYPISSVNNQLGFHDGTFFWNFTIPINNYTGDQFATALENGFAGTGTVLIFNVTYDDQSKLLTITADGPFQILTEPLTTMHDEMGFAKDTTHLEASDTHISDYPVHLSGSKYIDIEVDYVTRNYVSGSSSRGTVQRIPLRQGFGQYVDWQASNPNWAEVESSTIDELNVFLRDDRGNKFALPRNSNMSLVFELVSLLRGSKMEFTYGD